MVKMPALIVLSTWICLSPGDRMSSMKINISFASNFTCFDEEHQISLAYGMTFLERNEMCEFDV